MRSSILFLALLLPFLRAGAQLQRIENYGAVYRAVGAHSTLIIPKTEVMREGDKAYAAIALVGGKLRGFDAAVSPNWFDVGGEVSSVFGRKGAVVAAQGDYSAFYAPLTGSANYIHNGTGQQAANFHISGDGTAAGSIVGGTIKGLTSTSLLQGIIADLHPESNTVTLPFLSNDIAYTTLRGGSMTDNYGMSAASKEILVNGASDYQSFNTAAIPAEGLIIEITMHRSFSWGSKIGVSFGAANWRAKRIIIERFRADNNTWDTAANVSNWAHPIYQVGTGTSGYGVSKLRFTFNDFATAGNGNFRLSELWLVNYQSNLAKEVFVGRDGGDLYKTLQPFTDNAINLGNVTKAWQGVHTYGVHSPSSLYLNTTNGNSITFSASGVERARIATTTGNFLIGTGSDNGYKLEVNGTARVIGDLTASANLLVDPTAASTANRGVFIGGSRAMFGWDGDKLSAFVRSGDVSKHISFGYGSFGTSTEWGRFSATTGNLLVGTTTDNGAKLQVNGPISLYQSATAPTSPANGWQYYKTGTGPQDYVEGTWRTRAYAGGTDYVASTTDNVLAVSAGVITTRKAFNTATDATTVVVNAALGPNWVVTPTANRTLSITNAQDGEQIALYIVQDATGGRAMVWPTGTVWLNGVEPTLKVAPGDVDRVVFVRNATTATWYASY